MRIQDLTELTSVANDDLLPIEDISTDTDKKITRANLLSGYINATEAANLSNKDLQDSTTTVSDNSDSTKKFRFEASGITAGQTRVLTVPDASTTLAGTDTIQPLTNKSIDFDSNTITNNWWQELGRQTISSPADSLTVSFTAKKYIKVLASIIPTGSVNFLLRFNNDSGSNYAFNVVTNGTATSGGSQTSLFVDAGVGGGTVMFIEFEVINVAAREKLVNGLSVGRGTAGAANAPSIRQGFGKWANTADQITRVDIVNSTTGDYDTGSELIILGHN
jgi:hypothetical protein